MIVMLVRQIMSREVVTVNPKTTLGEVRELLDKRRIRRVPVVDGGRLAGIVSDRDVRSATGTHPAATAVGRLMTRDPVTVTSGTRVERAAGLILSRRIGGLPVVDGHELVGIVTETDLLRALVGLIETATLERIAVDLE